MQVFTVAGWGSSGAGLLRGSLAASIGAAVSQYVAGLLMQSPIDDERTSAFLALYTYSSCVQSPSSPVQCHAAAAHPPTRPPVISIS